jgi:CDP-diacylglycerol--glycerol-3-phosphate 3-phosphatidyltransferase
VARVFTVPNALTLFRILLVPLLVVVLLTKFEGKALVGLGVFLLASLTDFLDGFIARRRQQVSKLGKLLDPAADKILVSAALIALIELDVAPAWMVMVILAREFLISAFRSLAAGEGIVMSASWMGKLKTALQIVAISLLTRHRCGRAQRRASRGPCATRSRSVPRPERAQCRARARRRRLRRHAESRCARRTR